MNLLEYEAKQILRTFEVPVPKSTLVLASNEVVPAVPIVLKSQVHTGGRGKLGGVRVLKEGDTTSVAKEIFALPIKGELPRTLLAEEPLDIANEYYLSLHVNRSSGTIELVAHTDGGVEVESQENFVRLSVVDGKWYVVDGRKNAEKQEIASRIAEYFGLEEKEFLLGELIEKLYTCFVKSDALLLEINPLVLTKSGELVAGDCKMTLDDAAAFRHPEWAFERPAGSTNFVTLNPKGTVATIANGAGLAMATVDAVKAVGLEPANFLDIGGGATVDGIVKSFKSILDFPCVTAIVINIFGGIVRCDDVAVAILEAQKQFSHLPKLYIRLSGTRSEEATKLLADANLPLYSDLPAALQELTT